MTQEQALDVLKTGANVFLTGEPGAGKTHVINEYIAWLEACGLKVAVTASTGIAATHIGGMTIHSWSGVGARDTLDRMALDQIVSKEKIVNRVKKTHVLVIDEISMLDGKLVDMVNVICRTVLRSNEAFGGLQVIFVGDFYQLPPVTRNGDMMRYAFDSRSWQDARPLICYLTEQHRQEDEMLLGLLSSIRSNDVEEEHFTLLSEQTDIAFEQLEPTKLYTHNADVDAVNEAKLKELGGEVRRFTMSGRGNKTVQETLSRTCLSPGVLELSVDAMVMCTKNNFEAGYVNGTLGRVVEFESVEGWPIIETLDGRRIKMEATNWTVAEDNKVLGEITQVPLRLAWAITIHKSQGMSLDAAEIDLSRAFVFGQGYVALSRVRSLAGLKVLGMGPTALRVDPKVVEQDERFRSESEQAEDTFNEMTAEETVALHQQFVKAKGGAYVAEVDAKAVTKAVMKRQESTYEETKRLLTEGNSVRQIAKVRDMNESTIWSHLEKLYEQDELTEEMLTPTKQDFDTWSASFETLAVAMDEVGTEKLKPIFEATNEQFEYDLIRLARLQYTLMSPKAVEEVF